MRAGATSGPATADGMVLAGEGDVCAAEALADLAEFAQRAYLEYAVSVVKGRALPDVGDGCKPVQRRILYAMHRMGLAAGTKHVKSARVVGDVLGKYHPHGDAAAYEALVRMAQDFSLRYPLIDGQGNFGSRDGDSAAAMRYTEARLTPMAQLLLDEIDESTVDFVANYDGSGQEPCLLPARLPLVLLNGASGIAVGMATEIPSHNLREIAAAAQALLKNPNLADSDLLGLVSGPDFPGGAQVISTAAEIREAYQSGRGSLRVRARWKIEPLARGQWQLVVTELPPGASAARVLAELEALSDPKPKAGKKALSAEQAQLRQQVLAVLETARDESGREVGVRLVFEPRAKSVAPDELVAVLIANTSLETSVPVNLTTIRLDGRPAQQSLREILSQWIQFRLDTLRRRSQHRLACALARMHVLEGRQTALLHIDDVIRIVRESDTPKKALVERFALSEQQADDILEIKLRQLARLEALKIAQELDELQRQRQALEQVLSSRDGLANMLAQELARDVVRYGDERRTLIQESKRACSPVSCEAEPVVVVVSAKGWARAVKGQLLGAAGLTLKPGDHLYGQFRCTRADSLVVLNNRGRAYSVPAAALLGAGSEGVPLTSQVDLEPGTRLAHYWAGCPDATLLLATSEGYGLLAGARDLGTRQRAGKAFLSTGGGEALPPLEVAAGHVRVGCLSSDGRLLIVALDEIKRQPGGGRGLMLLNTGGKATLVAAQPFAHALEVRGLGPKGKAQIRALSANTLGPYSGPRARRGRKVEGFTAVVALSPG